MQRVGQQVWWTSGRWLFLLSLIVFTPARSSLAEGDQQSVYLPIITNEVDGSLGTGATAANWELRVDFPNDQLHVEWIVRMWGVENGRPVVKVEVPFDLSTDCKTHGNFMISNQRAIFDGTSAYLQCPLPGFLEKLAEIDPEFKDPGPGSSGDSWLTAQVLIDVGEVNPLFWHPNLGVSTPAGTASDGVRDGHTELRMTDAVSGTNVIVASADWQISENALANLWSGKNEALFEQLTDLPNNKFLAYLSKPPGNFRNAAQNIQQATNVWQWIASPQTERTSEQQLTNDLYMSGNATDIYIGYDPISNQFFHGELLSLLVDPPIREH